GGLGRQVGRQAERAAFDRRRVAEHGDATTPLDRAVGHHDDEVDHGHEDDEVDDGRDQGAEVDQRGLVVGAAELDPQPGRLTALKPGDDRIDDVGGERGNQVAEGEGDDQAHRHNNDVPAHQEVLEPLDHANRP